MTGSPWLRSWRVDPAALLLADRYYNRQAHGTAQFVPPGSCLVLPTAADQAARATAAEPGALRPARSAGTR